MKLGSLKSGRDGRLVVVSDDLAWCAEAAHLAPTLQAALDDWARIEPQLRLLATDLAHGVIPRDRFHEREADAPLPRAYQWADGSAYVNHVELVRKAGGGIVVAPDDAPRGVSGRAGWADIKLVGLVNDVSLHNLTPAELGKGFGF